jgi:hypothetical protein
VKDVNIVRAIRIKWHNRHYTRIANAAIKEIRRYERELRKLRKASEDPGPYDQEFFVREILYYRELLQKRYGMEQPKPFRFWQTR